MKQSRTKLARIIADQTLQEGTSQQMINEVAAYLLSERRVNELDSVMRDVQADWAEAGQVEVIVRSAHPLNTQLKADITKRLKPLYPQAKRIIITEVHDPNVIGGVKLNLADQQLDLSIQTKLSSFKQAAMTGKD